MNINQQHLQQWQPVQGFILFSDINLMTASLKKITEVGSIVGRAQFLEESLIIIEGVEKEQLEQGLAHDPLSSLPGREENCLIYGHREQFLWSLKDLKVGEPIIIESIEGIFYYTVDEISIRLPHDPYIFESTEESVLTLVTCYPFVYFGPNKERYFVKSNIELESDNIVRLFFMDKNVEKDKEVNIVIKIRSKYAILVQES